MTAPTTPVPTRPRYRETLRQLGRAQKSRKGGQAYSVFVNRGLGRLAAAAAHQLGLTPNAVTAVSAAFSLAGILVIALVGGPWAALAAPLLATGYVLDSADGQLARLRHGGSLSGEWLDHMVDSVKITALHLAVAVHVFRHTDLSAGWLAVPLAYTVVGVAAFFAQLLNEQLQRNFWLQAGGRTDTQTPTSSAVMLFAKLPHDYGVLCWSFVLLMWPTTFATVYAFLMSFNAAYLAAAVFKWYAQMRDLDSRRPA